MHEMTYLAFVVLCIVVHVLHISQFDLTTRQWRANISLVQKTTITFKNINLIFHTWFQRKIHQYLNLLKKKMQTCLPSWNFFSTYILVRPYDSIQILVINFKNFTFKHIKVKSIVFPLQNHVFQTILPYL